MINEEGGIDPEQFRMEAMFDRMDAIGKGILGLTHPVRAVPQPQVRSAHAGRVLPAVRLPEQLRTKRSIAVYTPEEQMQRAEIFAADPRDRSRAAASASRLAGAHGRLGRQRARQAAAGVDRRAPARSTTSRPAGRSICRRRTARSWRGLRADQAHVRDDACKTEVARASPAFRLELLNDPEPAARRAGPLVQGHLRADRVRGRGRAGGRPESQRRSSSPRPRPTSNPAGDAAGADLRRQDAGEAASPGRSHSPSTARTRPPGASTSGPAAATSRARPSSSRKRRSPIPAARCSRST